MATGRTASAGMGWLHAWARGLGVSSVGDGHFEILAAAHRASIHALIADPVVQRQLTVAYLDAETRLGQEDARAAVQSFLVEACWLCSRAVSVLQQAGPPGSAPSRSAIVDELQALAVGVATLATRLRRAPIDLGGALDTEYLRKRHQAGNPVGFILQRQGWHTALPSAGVTVDLYLDALAADIREEAALRQIAVDSRRQIGGKLAPYYPVIDMLTICSGRLSASPDFVLIADVINLLVAPNPPLDPDPLRKRYMAK